MSSKKKKKKKYCSDNHPDFGEFLKGNFLPYTISLHIILFIKYNHFYIIKERGNGYRFFNQKTEKLSTCKRKIKNWYGYFNLDPERKSYLIFKNFYFKNRDGDVLDESFLVDFLPKKFVYRICLSGFEGMGLLIPYSIRSFRSDPYSIRALSHKNFNFLHSLTIDGGTFEESSFQKLVEIHCKRLRNILFIYAEVEIIPSVFKNLSLNKLKLRGCGIIHGDLSEYNIVETNTLHLNNQYPLAAKTLIMRSCKNLKRLIISCCDFHMDDCLQFVASSQNLRYFRVRGIDITFPLSYYKRLKNLNFVKKSEEDGKLYVENQKYVNKSLTYFGLSTNVVLLKEVFDILRWLIPNVETLDLSSCKMLHFSDSKEESESVTLEKSYNIFYSFQNLTKLIIVGATLYLEKEKFKRDIILKEDRND